MIKKFALANGAFDVVVASHWGDGGAGACDVADALMKACNEKANFKFLYNLEMGLEEKINIIAKEMYGAGSVEFTEKVIDTLKKYTEKVSSFNFINECAIAVSFYINCEQNWIKLGL